MAGAWQLTLPGVVESLGAFPCRPHSQAKIPVFSKQKTHFSGRRLQDWGRGSYMTRPWCPLLTEEQKTFARLELFSF
jgi:hypothetical protein